MIINYKSKKIKVSVRKVSEIGKGIGLIFKSKNTENLLFEFKNKTCMRIHSYFVFFSFLAIWIGQNNEVLDWKMVKPFTLSVKSKKYFSKLVEIPINKKNKKIVEFFVGKGKI
jgi:uncharacterized membrane protein (UPF0127 family)